MRPTAVEAAFPPKKVWGFVRGRQRESQYSARGVRAVLGPTGAVVDFLWFGDKLDRNGNAYVKDQWFSSADTQLAEERLVCRRLAPVATRALSGASR